MDMLEPVLEAPGLTETDSRYLAEAITLSRDARDNGRHPFAALVLSGDGDVVARTINNSSGPGGDPTQHAELLAVAAAARLLSAADMRTATLYTSAEPCAMCSGAAYWTGVGRVVFALSERRLLELTGDHPENPTLRLPCREVFAAGQRRVDVVGPVLEDEAADVHDGFWAGQQQA